MHAMKLVMMLILLIIFTAKFPSDHVAAAARPPGGMMKPKTFGPKTAFLPQARESVPTPGPNPCKPKVGGGNVNSWSLCMNMKYPQDLPIG
ncbi:hypothetical protein ACFX13_004212 [Malus domestica]